jgi:heat shock protein HtpX
MIANPFRRGTFGVGNLFSTHPPMDERIRRLQDMAQAGRSNTGGIYPR